MVVKVLCVAEKPSIAKAVANHLSSSVQTRNVPGNQYIKNYCFHYNFPGWGQADVTMTSVSGHLLSQDFESQYTSWTSCEPSMLFDARIETFVAKNNIPIQKNIEQQARYAHYLYIWTDCDREGENIGTEIRDIAAGVNSGLKQPGKTVRARFSNIEKAHIISAARNPGTIDEAQSQAVASRIEIDLRTGACFTRKLTRTLQNMLSERQTISYGSCQFPTLGFVVDRYFRVRNFVPEKFWSIQVRHEKEGVKVNFRWARNHLFDRLAVVVLFERCLTAKTARVTKVQTKPTSKWKPLPLTTVELQKCGSRFLGIDSQKTLQIAERLYQNGWISYPRTETDQFDRGMNLQDLVQKQTQGGQWASHAQQLANGGFTWPRNGRNNDKAHPPIHPVNFVNPSALQSSEERKVHEFVVRRFLACCSEDAKGAKTEVAITYGDESFHATGLIVLERNYLDVYPYDKWTSSQQLPRFTEGEVFEPNEAYMQEGETTAPGYLTEPELIALMDANGIGTDATMAEHIFKIKERKYVETRLRGAQTTPNDEDSETNHHATSTTRGGGRGGQAGRGGRGGARGGSSSTSGVQEFIPTTLGVALVEGFDSMGFDTSLSKPFLRKEMELRMKAICEGRVPYHQVIQEQIEQYRAVYVLSESRMDVLKASIRKYVLGENVAS